MPLFLFYISQIGIETSTFIYSNFCLGVAWWCGRDVVWRLVCFGSALTWLWLGLKSAEELSHSPQWRSTVRTLVNRPMGRFAWTNHIYFQITQHGSSTVTPLYRGAFFPTTVYSLPEARLSEQTLKRAGRMPTLAAVAAIWGAVRPGRATTNNSTTPTACTVWRRCYLQVESIRKITIFWYYSSNVPQILSERRNTDFSLS
jgi:hypothetical protein